MFESLLAIIAVIVAVYEFILLKNEKKKHEAAKNKFATYLDKLDKENYKLKVQINKQKSINKPTLSA
jgi:hypothetical protein